MSGFRRHLEASVEDPEFKRERDVQAAEREVMTCVWEGCPGVCLPAAPARVGKPSLGIEFSIRDIVRFRRGDFVGTSGTTYSKPNMAALEGETGRRIFETIRNAPNTDWEGLRAKSREVEERILAARKAKR